MLPLLGYYFDGEEMMMPNLVSEWVEDGTLDEYMETLPRVQQRNLRNGQFSLFVRFPRPHMMLQLLGISKGLAYLHSLKVIHADLKSVRKIHHQLH